MLIPLVIVGGLAAVILSTLTDYFRTPTEVTVVRPVPGRVSTVTGQVLFQAAGWVEPDPFPIRVTPLVKGVVRKVLVQESEAVTAGQTVALLYDEEDRFRLDQAIAALARVKAQVLAEAAELKTAEESFDAALDYQEQLGSAVAEAEGTAAEAEHRAASVRKAQAGLKLAEEELTLQRYLLESNAAGPRQVEIAEATVEERRGEVEVMKADAVLARAQAQKAQVKLDRLKREGPLRFEEKLRIAKSKALLQDRVAEVAELEAKRALLQLAFERTEVRAPEAGIVLARLAVPGSVVDPAMPDAPPICTLFDPMNVRIRVDVPQELVGRAHVHQEAQIFSESRRDKPYLGKVLRMVQTADINKVTLQVHVRVLEPDGLLRPEMLCQVRFLGGGSTSENKEETAEQKESLRIPTRLVSSGQVWLLAADGKRAEKRAIEIAHSDSEWTEVTAGLNASDKLIDSGREALQVGSPVRVKGGK
jgi:multidrug efflux pump subunit AcrA (membrane-fusion protein)